MRAARSCRARAYVPRPRFDRDGALVETIYFRAAALGERPINTLQPLVAPEAAADSAASLELIRQSLTPLPGEVFECKPYVK